MPQRHSPPFTPSRIIALVLLCASLFMVSNPAIPAELKVNNELIPQLRKTGAVTQLYVHNKPFLALGGELGNSTASDIKVLTASFDKLQAMHLNTVMLPVYWDLIEPQEGKFDFSLVQGAIEQARAHNLHLVYLWFGTWKNSMSCYAPGWVKRDITRFERAKQTSGEAMEIISPASDAACDADARAFAALMRWTRQFDASQQTVIMAQVENEIGMIPQPRDHSEKSQALYQRPVPSDLMVRLSHNQLGPEVAAIWENAGHKTSGNWGEIFGTDPAGEEIFSAWQFSTFTEKVAAAGKHEYPLPMYANAALMRPNYAPGQYPSAGPLPHLMEVWRLGAPSLDMLCPDIYFPSFPDWCGRYVRSGNPIFIPEMAPSIRSTANAVYAAAHFNAIGFGPFSVENSNAEKEEQITQCYQLLSGLSSLVLDCQQQGKLIGLSPQVQFDWSIKPEAQRGELAGIIFNATFDHAGEGNTQATTLPTLGVGRWEAPPGVPAGSAMVLQIAPEEFIVLGKGVTLTFAPADGKGKVGIDQVQEGYYDDKGTWIGARWLNGDETHQGRHVHLYDGSWSIQRVKLYRY